MVERVTLSVHRWFAVAALCLAGCIIDKFPTETESESGSGSSTTGTSTTGTTAEPTTGSTGGAPALCPEHAAVDDCCCFEHEMSELHGSVSNVCGETPLCPLVVFQCEGVTLDGPCTMVGSEDDLDCVVKVFAEALPGTVAIRYETMEGYPNRFVQYFLVGDGTAFRIDRTTPGEYSEWAATGRYTLQESTFFADCVMGTVEQRAVCVAQATVGDALEVCVEAFVSQDVV